ncbi:MAG: hypothetical protein K0U38_04165 [Epsilonproteobacteria bacterium]|nr:hypothetical protein [Campylobacterota bacterium]
MSLNLSTMERVAGRLLDTLKRFPLAALMALLCTIILIVLSDIEYNIQETLPHYNMASKVAYVMSIGFFLFVALRLISKNIMLTLLGIILLIG